MIVLTNWLEMQICRSKGCCHFIIIHISTQCIHYLRMHILHCFSWQESTHMCMNLRLYKYVFRQFADCYLLICLFSVNVVGIDCLLSVIVVLVDCLILNVHYYYLLIVVCWQWVSVAKCSSSLIFIIHCCLLLILWL